MSQLPEERQQLAAEFALGALSGDDLARANALMASDADFRREVARWGARLAPMLDEVEAVEPPAALQARIEARLANPVVSILTRKVKMWRGISAGITAIAASLALVLLVGPQQRKAAPTATLPPMVAMLGDAQAPAKMMAAWDPQRRTLTVMAPQATPAEAGHSHELWVIPADGTPRSLGVMPDSAKMQMVVGEPMLGAFGEGITLAVSVEPAGGSTTGAPTGPVIASGKLQPA